MKLEEVASIVGEVPHMTRNQGELIYNMILDNDISNILELGIAHGTGSCYMGAALQAKGSGSVITIDNQSAFDRNPNVNTLVEKCNLEAYVNPIFAHSSYNWELMKLIDRQTKGGYCEPIFDFCYIDGAHNFEIDGCAFLLVDKLLKPGGFLLFDDLNWTYAASPALKNTQRVKQMATEEKNTPHIKKLVELIVVNHPNYENPDTLEEWFLIRKKTDNYSTSPSLSLNKYKVETSIGYDLKKLARKIKKRVF